MTQLTPNHRPDTPPTEDFTREEVRLRRYFLRQQVPVPDADRELEQLYRKRRSQLVRRTAVWGSVAALIALAVWLAPSLVGRQAQQVVHTAPAVDEVTLQTARGERLTIGSADGDDALHTLGATLDDSGSRLAYDDRSATPVQMQVLSTPARRTFHVTLSDGTEVWLNAGSRLTYPNRFTDGGRTVELEGEAYFRVAKDAARPFTVKSGPLSTRVLGTEFNVRRYASSDTHVTLLEGSVEVQAGTAPAVRIAPGQDASPSADGTWRVTDVDTDVYCAWRKGLFYFDHVPLREVLCELGRWYDRDVRFDPSADTDAEVFFTARRTDPLEDIVSLLNSLHKAHIRIGEDAILVSKQ